MSNNNNDGTTQAGLPTTPGQRRPTASTGRARSNRDIPGTARSPGPPGSSNDGSRPMVHVPTVRTSTTEDQVPQDQVPPHGFTEVVADGTRNRHNRRTATVSRVMAIPHDSDGTSPPTGPNDENRLLPVADLFEDDDNILPPQQPAPTQLEDRLDAIMRAMKEQFDAINAMKDQFDAINTRFDDAKLDTNHRFDDAKLDTNNRFDAIIAKLDVAIDNAILGKIEDVVTEVTNRALPIIADQIQTQVSTTIDSHMAELRQTHTNMHNIDNSINSFKQRIEGDISSFRSTAETVTDLQQHVTDIDMCQADLLKDVRLMLYTLRDNGTIKYPPHDDDNDTTGNTGNVDNNNSNDRSNINTSDNYDDIPAPNPNIHNINDTNVDSPTPRRSLEEYASTTTPASRAIQAHTTGHRIVSTTIQDSEDHAAEERIGHNHTTRNSRDNTSRVNICSDNSPHHRSESDNNRERDTFDRSGPHDNTYMGRVGINNNNLNRDGYYSTDNNNRDGFSNNITYDNSPNTRADHHTYPSKLNNNNPYTRPNVNTYEPHYTTVHEYQGSHDVGMQALTDEILASCGYTTNTYSVEDLSTVYNDLKTIHRHVVANWYQYQSYHSQDAKEEGPQVQRIVAKNLTIFPKLHSTSMQAVIEFYDKLQRLSFKYLMPLVPFNHILLQHKSFGLCIPHLGKANYRAAAAGLLELLPHLIPSSLSKNFNANITSITSTSKNGYDVVWNILYQSVPGFDPSKSLPTPTWTPNHDIFDFSEEFTTYFRVQRLLKQPQSDSTKSLMFLNAITSPEYIETVGILTTAVESKVFDNDNSPLPPHLQIHGLATRLAKISTTRVSAAITPYANRTFGPPSHQHWVPHELYPPDSYPTAPTIDPYYETYEVNRVGDQRVRFDGNTQQSPGRDAYGRTRYPRSPSTGPRSDSTGLPPILRGSPQRGGAQQPNQGRQRRPMPNPSRNTRRPYVAVQCRACKRVGHDERNCDMLAMAIALHQYRRDHLTPEIMNTIEHEWMERHRARLDNVTQTPRQVLRAYADENDYTTADIDAAMDWSIWEDDSPVDQDPVE